MRHPFASVVPWLLPLSHAAAILLLSVTCKAENTPCDVLLRLQGGMPKPGDIAHIENILNATCEIPGNPFGGALETGDHWTPLAAAVATSRFTFAAYLVGKGADVNMATMRGYSPLWTVCNSREGDSTSAVELCMLLLESGADTELSPTKQCCPPMDVRPLHVACLHGNTQLLKFLLKKGARVDALDSSGAGALQYAKIGKRLASNKAIAVLNRPEKIAAYDEIIAIVQDQLSPSESRGEDGP